MSPPSYRPANDLDEQRWEFIWWGFGKKARLQRGFEANAPVHRTFRFGPLEIRLYLERKRPSDEEAGRGSRRPVRQIRGPSHHDP